MADAGRTDSGVSDAGATDAGSTDAGASDAATVDAGGTDSGSSDVAGADSGSPDAAPGDAAHVPDAGAADASQACFAPPGSRSLRVWNPQSPLIAENSFVLLTGEAPEALSGSPLVAVEVNGEARGVRLDRVTGSWSYLLAHPPGTVDLAVTAKAASGAIAGPLTVQVRVSEGAYPARDITPGIHTVGSWMFTWFTGDTSWRCKSPWHPPGGFGTWDGSVQWARGQLLDQLDASLDLVGLQLDTVASTGGGKRWTNVVNVLRAARQLLDEGFEPPRLFPFVDTAIIADFYRLSSGATLDVSTSTGETHLYLFFKEFYAAIRSELGPRLEAAASARYLGRPYVSMWHSVTINGESDAVVQRLKSRFLADFGASPYLVGHPNDWRNFASVDEITLMVGPPTHYHSTGRDGNGRKTANIEPGFWNPVSNSFYLPRSGGGNYDAAWASALAVRGSVEHLYIDTWNETGEGSGIFEAVPTSYTADDAGPCGQFVHRHDESWGASGRRYIDTTRSNARLWNDVPDREAVRIVDDLPATMRAGERRGATVLMRNHGDLAWSEAAGTRLATRDGSASFGDLQFGRMVLDPSTASKYAGAPRGFPAAFPVMLTAPCATGSYTLRLGLRDATGSFGPELVRTIVVTD